MLKWKIVPESDTKEGIHTRFEIRMYGNTFQLHLEDDGTYTILKKEVLSDNFIVIKSNLLGIKPAKKYFAQYIL